MGPAGTEIVVPNEAALAALAGKTNGISAFVETHRSVWRVDFTSTLAPVPHMVIPNAAGGNWMRTAYADPTWREEITDVYIDPGNVTGIADDQNKAIFNAPQVGPARLPLLTWQELSRRWGRRNTISTGDFIGLTFQVHVLSGRPLGGAQDPADLDWVNFEDTYPRILGENATVVFGPAALGAFVAQNPAVPAPGGTPCSITIGATVWGPLVGKRLRRIADGSVAVVLKDLGAGQARISQPGITNEALFFINPTAVVWAPGDVVVVEDLPDFNPQHFVSGFEGSAFGFAGQTNIADLNFTNEGAVAPWLPAVEDDNNLVVYQSTSDRPVGGTGTIIYNGCSIRSGGQQLGSSAAFFGGAILPGLNASFLSLLIDQQTDPLFGFGYLDYFVYIQGGGVILANCATVAAFSVWDAALDGNFNPAGHALCIGGGPNLGARPGIVSLRSSNTIFGSGSLGLGCRVGSGSKIASYNVLPNITGALGQLSLADSALGFWGDFATGTYQPPGGAVLTWPAIAAPIGIAGFGNSAHNHDQDAHINKGSAS